MTIKYRLQNYYNQQRELEQIRERIEELEDKATSIKSSSDVGIIAGGGNTDKVGSLVASILDLKDYYTDKCIDLFAKQKEIEVIIDKLEPLERLLIRARYIDGNAWEQVCLIMGYSWTHTHDIHSKILKELEKENNNE